MNIEQQEEALLASWKGYKRKRWIREVDERQRAAGMTPVTYGCAKAPDIALRVFDEAIVNKVPR